MAETKWMFVARPQNGDQAPFAAQMLREAGPKLLALKPARAKLTVTETPPPKGTIFGFRKDPVAVVHAWGDDDRARYQSIFDGEVSVTAYKVDESTPVPYERTWPDGQPTPTPILLTVLHKKPGLSDDEYIRRWHGGHTPLSLKIHPLWFYQRNVILEQVGDAAGRCDGIVEEACDTRETLLSPTKFFGGTLRMLPNMIRVGIDIKGFIDMSKIEVYYATEYHLLS